MKKKSALRKVLATTLSAVTLLGTGYTTFDSYVGTNISVSAEQINGTKVYGDFNYVDNDDGTIRINKYIGSGGDVTIPDTIYGKKVTSIDSDAFRICTKLTSITIPDSVTSPIYYCAFENCYNLKTVNIGSGITSISTGAFNGCSQLKSVNVSENNTTYSSDDGVLFNKDKTKIVFCPKGKQGIYTVPDSVTEIGYCAFEKCSLTNVIIGNNVNSIGNSAFGYCTRLTSVNIPGSVTSISSSAFTNCTNLTSITVDENNTVYSSEDGVLLNKDKTKIVIFPKGKSGAYTVPASVTSIGYVFSDCIGLTNVTISGNITSIGEGAFSGCTNLTNVTISDSVISICYNAFSNCTSLMDIAIPDSVTSIGSSAFNGCTNLTNITLPESVNLIGECAFLDCTNLTSITILNDTIAVGNSAFDNTAWYNNQPDGMVYVGNTLYKYKGNIYENTSIEIPENTIAISSGAFYGCSGLKSVTIPKGITSIESHVFENCTCLTSVTIPESVTSIGNYTFSSCTELKKITISDNVTSIGDGTFNGCTNLVIYGKSGSYAEQYANDYGIPFIEIATYVSEVPATCTSDGKQGYYSRYGRNYEDADCTIEIDDITAWGIIPSKGHDWETNYTWSDDNSTVTAIGVCENDTSHTKTETVNTSYQVTKAATCTTSGTGKFTASFSNTVFTSQTKNIVIPATGHYYLYDDNVPTTEDGHTMKCAVCGETIIQEHMFDEDHICTVCGYEQSQSIDWSKVTFEFDNGSGVYAYTGKTIEPDFTLYYDGEKMTLDFDYCLSEDSDDSSKRTGKHTIVVCDINDEENIFSFDYYIYNLSLTATEDTSADNKVKFIAAKNADKNNIKRFGMVLDRSGAFGENVSLDNNTSIFNTTNKSTNKYTVTAADRGCGVWAMAYMQISLNGENHMVYSQIKHETRYTPEQIANPSIQNIVPQIINNKVFAKVVKPAYDMNLYICKEMGILFSKNGTITSLENAQTNDTLIYENVGNGIVSKGYLNAQRIGKSSIDEYSTYSTNISFVSNNPVYTRAYVIFTNKETGKDMVIYGDYFVINPNS